MGEIYVKDRIIESSWGYDQTNIDFYKILKRQGNFVTLVKMGSQEVGREGSMVGPSGVDKRSMTGRVIPTDVLPNAKPFRRKVHINKQGEEFGVAIQSYGWASLWDGEPSHFSSYANPRGAPGVVNLSVARPPDSPDEWRVNHVVDGKAHESKAYFTGDRDEAVGTMYAMKERFEGMGHTVKIVGRHRNPGQAFHVDRFKAISKRQAEMRQGKTGDLYDIAFLNGEGAAELISARASGAAAEDLFENPCGGGRTVELYEVKKSGSGWKAYKGKAPITTTVNHAVAVEAIERDKKRESLREDFKKPEVKARYQQLAKKRNENPQGSVWPPRTLEGGPMTREQAIAEAKRGRKGAGRRTGTHRVVRLGPEAGRFEGGWGVRFAPRPRRNPADADRFVFPTKFVVAVGIGLGILMAINSGAPEEGE